MKKKSKFKPMPEPQHFVSGELQYYVTLHMPKHPEQPLELINIFIGFPVYKPPCVEVVGPFESAQEALAVGQEVLQRAQVEKFSALAHAEADRGGGTMQFVYPDGSGPYQGGTDDSDG